MIRSSYPKIARQEKTSMEQEEPEQNGLGEGLLGARAKFLAQWRGGIPAAHLTSRFSPLSPAGRGRGRTKPNATRLRIAYNAVVGGDLVSTGQVEGPGGVPRLIGWPRKKPIKQ